jgi:hypothetical protein
MELLEDSSEWKEWKKLREKLHQARMGLLDAENEVEDFERDWAEEVKEEVEKLRKKK